MRSARLFLLVFLFHIFTPIIAHAQADIRINEVLFNPVVAQVQWVELYNRGSSAGLLTNHVLTDNDGNDYSIPGALPSVPTGAFVVVYFDGLGSGLDDYDFGDNVASLHTSAGLVAPFDSTSDNVSLYSSLSFGPDELVSFVAWGNPPGPDALDAVLQGVWRSDEDVISVDTFDEVEGPMYRLPVGGSVGVFPDDEVITLPHWVGYQPGLSSPGSANPGPGPTLYLPESAVLFEDGDVNFSWLGIKNSSSYHIQMDGDSTFATPEIDDSSLPEPFYTPLPSLPDGVHFWRARAFDAGNAPGAWSEVRRIEIGYLIPIAPSPAQVFAAGTVSGTVTDVVSGNPLAGVTVYIPSVDTVLTGPNGAYAITGAPDGTLPVFGELTNYGLLITSVTVAGGPATADFAMTGLSKTLGVPALKARKDGKLLCIDGCDEYATTQHLGEGNHHWDGSHTSRIHWGEHEQRYCVYTADAMMARYRGGTVTIEELAYEAQKGGGPEGDLSHHGGANIQEQRRSLRFALQTTDIDLNYETVSPTDAGLIISIDLDAPIRFSTGRHAMVVDGYRWVDKRVQGRFINTDNDGRIRWFFWEGKGKQNFDHLWTPLPSLAGRLTDPRVSRDTDGDGVMDFDEEERFQSSRWVADTDKDEVGDKNDIRNYTFHHLYHALHRKRMPASLYDKDKDGLYSENDCDSDSKDATNGDGDFDGGEDIDGDGHNPEAGETCMFWSFSWLETVSVDKDIYLVGEEVKLVDLHGSRETHTYHANSTYNYELGGGCPDKLNDSPLGHARSFTTDAGGHALEAIVDTCLVAGQYYITIDVLNDFNYSEPDNTDPQTCWSCEDIASYRCFVGDPLGGYVDMIVNDVALTVPTSPGESAADVTQNMAGAINADVTLQGAGIVAIANDGKVYTNGYITDIAIFDDGLFEEGSESIPALSTVGGLLLMAFLLFAGWLVMGRRSRWAV